MTIKRAPKEVNRRSILRQKPKATEVRLLGGGWTGAAGLVKKN